MLAHEMMSDTVPILSINDSIQKALNYMEVFKLSHLPVGNKEKFIGIVSDVAIYDSFKFDNSLGTIINRFENITVGKNQHILDIMNICCKYSLTSVPVVEDNNDYLGLIVLPDLVKNFSRLINVDANGGIITIQVNMNDYSLSNIAQIIESNNAKVLSMYVVQINDTQELSITLKLNTTELTSIVRTFERYEYEVKAIVEEQDTMNDKLLDNYELLMRYINT